jgi:hypothetical protein
VKDRGFPFITLTIALTIALTLTIVGASVINRQEMNTLSLFTTTCPTGRTG